MLRIWIRKWERHTHTHTPLAQSSVPYNIMCRTITICYAWHRILSVDFLVHSLCMTQCFVCTLCWTFVQSDTVQSNWFYSVRLSSGCKCVQLGARARRYVHTYACMHRHTEYSTEYSIAKCMAIWSYDIPFCECATHMGERQHTLVLDNKFRSGEYKVYLFATCILRPRLRPTVHWINRTHSMCTIRILSKLAAAAAVSVKMLRHAIHCARQTHTHQQPLLTKLICNYSTNTKLIDFSGLSFNETDA